GAYFLLSLSLKSGMPIGVAYGIWAALGITILAAICVFFFKEPLSFIQIIGIIMIVGGVLVLELGKSEYSVRFVFIGIYVEILVMNHINYQYTALMRLQLCSFLAIQFYSCNLKETKSDYQPGPCACFAAQKSNVTVCQEHPSTIEAQIDL